MCDPVVGSQLQRGIEILRSLLRILHVVQCVSAIDVSFHHPGIALNGSGVVVTRFVQQLRVLVNMTLDQREVRLVRQNGVVLIGDGEGFIVAAQVVEVVRQIPDALRSFGSCW